MEGQKKKKKDFWSVDNVPYIHLGYAYIVFNLKMLPVVAKIFVL